jgi:hypothetical protein
MLSELVKLILFINIPNFEKPTNSLQAQSIKEQNDEKLLIIYVLAVTSLKRWEKPSIHVAFKFNFWPNFSFHYSKFPKFSSSIRTSHQTSSRYYCSFDIDIWNPQCHPVLCFTKCKEFVVNPGI